MVLLVPFARVLQRAPKTEKRDLIVAEAHESSSEALFLVSMDAKAPTGASFQVPTSAPLHCVYAVPEVSGLTHGVAPKQYISRGIDIVQTFFPSVTVAC